MLDMNRYHTNDDDLVLLWDLIARLRAANVISLYEAQTNWDMQRYANKIDFISVAVGKKTEAELQQELAVNFQNSEDKKKEWLSIATDGLLTGDKADSSNFYRLPEDEFRVALKAKDNSLKLQISIFGKFLDKWHHDYESPPPYSAGRIAIILAKGKNFDEEFAFLEQYERHFGHFAGSRSHEKILERFNRRRATRANVKSE